MPHRYNDDVKDRIEQLSRLQKDVDADDNALTSRVDKFDKMVRLVGFLGAAFGAAVLWVGIIQYKVSAIEKEMDERKVQIEQVKKLWWMNENGMLVKPKTP